MKAVCIHEHAGTPRLRYEDRPRPSPSSNDVIVELRAAAINRLDLELARKPPCSRAALPRIPGADGAGVVHEIGSHVRAIKPGDAVCLFPFQDCRRCSRCERGDICSQPTPLGVQSDGTYAEYTRVPASNCFSIPAGLSFDEAAALPLSYVMAWRMLVSDADLKPGEWVLVVGAGGGIANAATQLAVAMGARVIVLSRSARKLIAARQLGATDGVTLSGADPFRTVRSLTGKRGFDVAVNCVGGDTWAPTLTALARGGRLVTCGAACGSRPQTDLRRIFWNHLTVQAAGSATRDEFERLLHFVAAGGPKPVIDSVFPLHAAESAHARLAASEQFGKIVLGISR